MKRGLLTEKQFRVLLCRGKGMTQSEAAKELCTTRANVSMIELRARKKIEQARTTLKVYQSTRTDHSVRIPRGTRTYDIPAAVLSEGDRFGIRIQSNIVEIIRMVKDIRPPCLSNGVTSRKFTLVFNQSGRLSVRR